MTTPVTTTPVTTRALRRWLWLGLCAALLMPLTGCTDEAELTETGTQVRFLHDLAQTGAVDVLVEGVAVARLEPGELSAPVDFTTDTVNVAVHTADGETLRRAPLELLRVPTVLVAISGEDALGAELVVIDEPPPRVLDVGHAAVEAVHLPGNGTALDVYIDDRLVAGSLAPDMISPFVAVEAGSRRVEVFAAGTDPIADTPLFTTALELLAGESVMIVLSDALVAGAEPAVVATILSVESPRSTLTRNDESTR